MKVRCELTDCANNVDSWCATEEISIVHDMDVGHYCEIYEPEDAVPDMYGEWDY